MTRATSERTAPRFAVETDCVAIAAYGGRLLGDRVEDLSWSGVRVSGGLPARLGEKVKLSLRIPESKTWVEAEGIVTRVMPGRRDEDRGPMAGIHITKMNGMSRVVLSSVAKTYPRAGAARRDRADYASAVARIANEP